MFLEQTETPPFLSGDLFVFCDLPAGANNIGFASLSAAELLERNFDVKRLSSLLSADQFAAPISVKQQEGEMVLLDRALLFRTIEIPPRRSDQFFYLIAIHGGVGRIHIREQSLGIQNGEAFNAVIHGALQLNQLIVLDFPVGDVYMDIHRADNMVVLIPQRVGVSQNGSAVAVQAFYANFFALYRPSLFHFHGHPTTLILTNRSVVRPIEVKRPTGMIIEVIELS